MTTIQPDHPWAADALFKKALLYVGEMESHTANDWQFAFWASLALECLARSALSNFSPSLLADSSNWRNVSHSLGLPLTAKKFSPTSVGTTEVLARLTELVPGFTNELAGFCTKMADRRNAELHTGEQAFAQFGTSEWLPKFYSAASVLLSSLGKSLADLVADAPHAQELVNGLEDAAAKAVTQDIKAYALTWSKKSAADQAEASMRATAWATRQSGHRVACPACNCPALLQGTPRGKVATNVEENHVIQRQSVMPGTLECVACGLNIAGLSKLSACDLGDAYTATSKYTAADFFGLYSEDEYQEALAEFPDHEMDFNE